MPYTVKINNSTDNIAELAKDVIEKHLHKDGRFTACLGSVEQINLGPKAGSRKLGFGFTVTRVRLTKAKPYCGQHPGVCIVNPYLGPQKKPKARLLEWDDWVAFNNLINDALDQLQMDADVWSLPQETKGRFWIRKGTRRRVAYDWDDEWRDNHWAPLQHWNLGTEDQFVNEDV